MPWGNNAILRIAKKELDLVALGAASDLKIILLNSAYVFDIDAHNNYSDVIANELGTGNGYTAGGQALTNVVQGSPDAGLNKVTVTTDPTTWNASGGDIGPASGVAVYDDSTANPATSILLAFFPFDVDKTAGDGAPFTVPGLEFSLDTDTSNSNNVLTELFSNGIDFDNGADNFKIILMASGFAFDNDTDFNYSDVSASELAAGNGYSTGGILLVQNVSRDDPANQTKVVFNNIFWTASGGTIGPAAGALVYKDTGTPASSTIVGYKAFSGDQTVGDGQNFPVSNIEQRM